MRYAYLASAQVAHASLIDRVGLLAGDEIKFSLSLSLVVAAAVGKF